jgi:hypothetical protein
VTETIDSQLAAIASRLEEQGVEIAQLRRALVSLGSHLVCGGPPGPKGYLAWHDSQMNPPAPPAPASSTADPVSPSDQGQVIATEVPK